MCAFKNASQLGKRVSANASITACVPRRAYKKPGLSLAAHVPGDLLSDLEEAGVIADPLAERNFRNATIWSANSWNLSLALPASVDEAEGDSPAVGDDGPDDELVDGTDDDIADTSPLLPA